MSKIEQLQFGFVLPYQKFIDEREWAQDWGNAVVNTYLMLKEELMPSGLMQKSPIT